jgi:hypothetical protein
METRVFDGHLVVDGQETGSLRLKVLLSTDNRVTTGTGSFPVPLGLVGVREGTSVSFRTDLGETINLLLSEIDPAEGRAYFLTLGALPKAARGRRAG